MAQPLRTQEIPPDIRALIYIRGSTFAMAGYFSWRPGWAISIRSSRNGECCPVLDKEGLKRYDSIDLLQNRMQCLIVLKIAIIRPDATTWGTCGDIDGGWQEGA